MLTIDDILKRLYTIAPFEMAESYDNVGLLVGDKTARVKRGLICLDITRDVVDEAKHSGIDLIISHHPIIFSPIKSVTKQHTPIVFDLIKHGISAIAMHTNLDLANGGVNDVLFNKLELRDKMPLSLDLESDRESMGLVGRLDEYISPDEFAHYVKDKLSANGIRYYPGNRKIKTVAICGGSGGSVLDTAMELGAHAFVTGDIKHDLFMKSQNDRFTLIDAGHYATEVHIVYELVKNLNDYFDDYIFKVAGSGDEKVKYL